MKTRRPSVRLIDCAERLTRGLCGSAFPLPSPLFEKEYVIRSRNYGARVSRRKSDSTGGRARCGCVALCKLQSGSLCCRPSGSSKTEVTEERRRRRTNSLPPRASRTIGVKRSEEGRLLLRIRRRVVVVPLNQTPPHLSPSASAPQLPST